MRLQKAGASVARYFQNVREIEFSEETMRNDENIVNYDSGNDDETRIIIFSNSRLIEFAKTCSTFAADGTFKVRPKVYNSHYTNGQLWTMHPYINGY